MSGSLLRDLLFPLVPTDFCGTFLSNGFEVFLRRRFMGGSELVSSSEDWFRIATGFEFLILPFSRRRVERRSGPAAKPGDGIV